MTPLAIAGSVVGAITAVGGIVMFHRATSVLSGRAMAMGQITDITKDDATIESSTGFYPTISFSTAEGEEHQIVGSAAIRQPRIGEKVKVAYDPTEPSNARVAGTGAPWVMPFLVTVAGLGILVYSIFGLRS